MKKFILLMLAVSLAALPVLSCAADEGGDIPGIPGDPVGADENLYTDPEGAENGEDGAEPDFPDLPDIHFGGYAFRIINVGEAHVSPVLTTFVVEQETGEALNDAVFRRNRRMEEQFGFTLAHIDVAGPGPARDMAQRSIQAASDDFDLAMMQPGHALSLAQEGMLEMLDSVPHIDLSAPWWDGDMVRDFSIGNRVFFASSDATFNHYSATMGIFFNKQMHAELGLDDPYELVNEGRWTLDRFGEMGRAALRDLDGDGVFDHNDQWGLVSFPHVYAIAILGGIGARYVVKDADDLPEFNLNTEGFISRFHTAFDILTEGWLFNPQPPPAAVDPIHRDMFLNNRALFWIDLLNWATVLRAMDNDFGILPAPKLDEQQEHHISGVGLPHVMTIPVTTADLERTGIILEALSAESRRSTLTVYYDTMLVNQIMNRDEESAEMLDIIFANRVYETGRQFWTVNIANPVSNAMRDGNREIVSIIERNEPAAVTGIQNVIDAFLAN